MAREVVDEVGKAITGFQEETPRLTTLTLDLARLERSVGKLRYEPGVITLQKHRDQYDIYLFGLGKCVRPQYNSTAKTLKVLIEPFVTTPDIVVTEDHGKYKFYMVENHKTTWDWDLMPWGGPIPGHPLWPDELELIKSTEKALQECASAGKVKHADA